MIPRDYHPGDEVRRIDWKASARTGALMVRSEENPWRSAITLVLDLRESDHRGREPESSVDAALSMAASIGCLALESGWDLTVRTTDDLALFVGSPMTGVEPPSAASCSCAPGDGAGQPLAGAELVAGLLRADQRVRAR